MNMKNSLSARNLISSVIITILMLYFMVKSPSPKIIFVPFLICSISMAGKSIAQILDKKKWELVFGKLFILGFLSFFIGFLVVAGYISIRDKNYSMLVFGVPFWLVGIYLIKNKLLNKKGKKNGESVLTFAVVISASLVVIALLAGIFLLVLGLKEANIGLIFGGIFFTFGSLAFMLAALTMHGCFDKLKLDVLGLYVGVVFVIILVFLGYFAYDYFSESDGSTVESREKLVGNIPRGSDWKIAKEMDIFINEAPLKDYRISVAYYDGAGNKYE